MILDRLGGYEPGGRKTPKAHLRLFADLLALFEKKVEQDDDNECDAYDAEIIQIVPGIKLRQPNVTHHGEVYKQQDREPDRAGNTAARGGVWCHFRLDFKDWER